MFSVHSRLFQATSYITQGRLAPKGVRDKERALQLNSRVSKKHIQFNRVHLKSYLTNRVLNMYDETKTFILDTLFRCV